MSDFVRDLYSAFFPPSKQPAILVVGEIPSFGAAEPVDEEFWLAEPAQYKACDHLERMLEFLQRTETARKLRLFACACCRSIWSLFEDERSRAAVEVAERFADGEASKTDLCLARALAFAVHEESRSTRSLFGPIAAVDAAGAELEWGDPPTDQSTAFRAATMAARRSANCPSDKREQIRLLQHIVGNSWRPHSRPPFWPTTVTSLGLSLYHGEDCYFALHDALLEVGHGELAEHFREPIHPKGCWALDLIRGRN